MCLCLCSFPLVEQAAPHPHSPRLIEAIVVEEAVDGSKVGPNVADCVLHDLRLGSQENFRVHPRLRHAHHHGLFVVNLLVRRIRLDVIVYNLLVARAQDAQREHRD